MTLSAVPTSERTVIVKRVSWNIVSLISKKSSCTALGVAGEPKSKALDHMRGRSRFLMRFKEMILLIKE